MGYRHSRERGSFIKEFQRLLEKGRKGAES